MSDRSAEWHLLVRMNEDRQRLDEFCSTGSERAFRELVERHLPLVYGTAMRLLNGDSHLAEDVAQAVFANLARKARSLPRGIVLAGWLHRDTRFTALEVLRKERRRKARELEAAAMQEADSWAHPVAWSSIQPILDELLDELEDADRHALLLRFLEQRSLLAVGNALGIPEDTARKRVQRALEKLRSRLVARGITTTGGALSAMLTSRGAEAVPLGLSARLAKSALVSAATTAVPSVGICTLMASTKFLAGSATALVLLIVGIGSAKWIVPSRAPEGASGVKAPGLKGDPRRFFLNRMFGGTRSRSETEAQSLDEATIRLALDQLHQALHDPKPTRRIPDDAITQVLGLLGRQRAAALPLLLEALRSGSELVRNRAADALGQIGPEAREAVPVLMQQLREGRAPELLVWTLERVAPSLDLVPALVAGLKDHPASWLTLANSLSSPVWGDARSVSEVVRPVLEDPDPKTRQIAAYAIAALLKDEVGEDARKVTLEGLRSSDPEVQRLALSALRNLGSDPEDPSGRMTRESLGASARDAIPALMALANQNSTKDLQLTALQILDVIDPRLRGENPGMQRLLQAREDAAAFERNARDGQFSVPELVEGLRKHPAAIGGIAEVLARLGSEAKPSLPALQDALSALADGTSDSVAEAVQRARDLDRVLDAIRGIAPDQPTPMFKAGEVQSVFEVLGEVVRGPDSDRGQKLMVALSSALEDLPRGLAVLMTADQMRRLLDVIQSADPSTYELVAAKVRSFSAGFAVPPKP